MGYNGGDKKNKVLYISTLFESFEKIWVWAGKRLLKHIF